MIPRVIAKPFKAAVHPAQTSPISTYVAPVDTPRNIIPQAGDIAPCMLPVTEQTPPLAQ